MSLPITGGDTNDHGPVSCVVRFIFIGKAGDQATVRAELHPDGLEGVYDNFASPAGIQTVTLENPVAVDAMQVPANLCGPDGSSIRFLFVVRPKDARWASTGLVR